MENCEGRPLEICRGEGNNNRENNTLEGTLQENLCGECSKELGTNSRGQNRRLGDGKFTESFRKFGGGDLKMTLMKRGTWAPTVEKDLKETSIQEQKEFSKRDAAFSCNQTPNTPRKSLLSASPKLGERRPQSPGINNQNTWRKHGEAGSSSS